MRQIIRLALYTTICCSAYASAGEPSKNDLDRQLEEARAKLDHAASLLADLYQAKYGKSGGADRAMLGVLLGEGPSTQGIELVGVTPGGGAEAAGVKAGDRLIQVGDVSLVSAKKPMSALVKFLNQIPAGDVVTVTVQRDGESLQMDVVTQSRLDNLAAMVEPKLAALDRELGDLGAQLIPTGVVENGLMAVDGDLASYFGVEQGILVVTPQNALRGGDILQAVQGEPLAGVQQAAKVLRRINKDAEVTVIRRGKQITIDWQ